MRQQNMLHASPTRRGLSTVRAVSPPPRALICEPAHTFIITGTLCGACQPGWGLVDEASCIKCPAKSLNDLYYALATIFTIFTIGMTVLSSLEAQKTARDIRDHGLDVAEVQQHTERLHQLDPAGQGWHGACACACAGVRVCGCVTSWRVRASAATWVLLGVRAAGLVTVRCNGLMHGVCWGFMCVARVRT